MIKRTHFRPAWFLQRPAVPPPVCVPLPLIPRKKSTTLPPNRKKREPLKLSKQTHCRPRPRVAIPLMVQRINSENQRPATRPFAVGFAVVFAAFGTLLFGICLVVWAARERPGRVATRLSSILRGIQQPKTKDNKTNPFYD